MKKRVISYLALAMVGVLAFASCAVPPASASDMAADKPAAEEMKNDESGAVMADDTMKDEKEFMGDAYNFELTDIKGDTYKLSDLQGKKVYIKFWASWCSICLAGIEELKELDEMYKDDSDVIVLTIVAPGASGEMQTDKFKEWFTKQEYEFLTLLDEGGPVMRQYGIRGFPTSVFIDTNGDVARTAIGHVDNESIELTLSSMS